MGDIASTRAKAIKLGLPEYMGAPCIECGCRRRRTKDCECVVCLSWNDGQTRRSRLQAWRTDKVARAAYERTRYRARKALPAALQLYIRAFDTLPTINRKKGKTMVAKCEEKTKARKTGRSTYASDFACPHCDGVRRYTSNGACVECTRKASRLQGQTEAGKAANRERQARFRARQLAKKTGLLDDI